MRNTHGGPVQGQLSYGDKHLMNVPRIGKMITDRKVPSDEEICGVG